MTLLAMIRCSESKKLWEIQSGKFLQLKWCTSRLRGRFIQQVDINIGFTQGQYDGNTLQLSA